LNLEDALSALGVVGPHDEFEDGRGADDFGGSHLGERDAIEGLLNARAGGSW
jgi:hypothetical protein